MFRLSERQLQTNYGKFAEILFYDGLSESIALVMGQLAGSEDVLCRIHSACIGGHVFNSTECTCREEMSAAQAAIAEAGRGLIIYLDQEGKGNGHLALMKSIPYKQQGFSQAEAYVKAGYQEDARDYRPAAHIINDLKIRSIVLLTGNPNKVDELRRFGINVTSLRPM